MNVVETTTAAIRFLLNELESNLPGDRGALWTNDSLIRSIEHHVETLKTFAAAAKN